MAKAKDGEVSVSLPFPVQINGVSYEGDVSVSQEIADGIAEIVDAVRAKEARDAELQAQAIGEASAE